MKTSTRLKVAYVGLAALDTTLSGSASPWAHRARFLTKPLLMPVLASSLAAAPATPLRTPVLAAQACGWVGDVALLSEKRKPFLVGSSAFGAGHAAYISGFARHRSPSPLLAARSTRVLGGVWAAAAPMTAFNAWRRDRSLALPVAAYSASLTSMAISAQHLGPSVSPSSRRLAAAGSLLFLASDAMLGLRKFALDDPPAGLEAAVMATYTSAQLLLSEAAARA